MQKYALTRAYRFLSEKTTSIEYDIHLYQFGRLVLPTHNKSSEYVVYHPTLLSSILYIGVTPSNDATQSLLKDFVDANVIKLENLSKTQISNIFNISASNMTVGSLTLHPALVAVLLDPNKTVADFMNLELKDDEIGIALDAVANNENNWKTKVAKLPYIRRSNLKFIEIDTNKAYPSNNPIASVDYSFYCIGLK